MDTSPPRTTDQKTAWVQSSRGPRGSLGSPRREAPPAPASACPPRAGEGAWRGVGPAPPRE
eukprot:4795775-Pyramimonas_sp.AAC.1